ncbi:pyridoxal phosphate-dependent aminotransferase [Treponema sp.]|uniref:pyridoxal phosphate-dependent aminotransferase n=1 Tax=Treponema sp. TaxID=166 RepID=UPI00298E028B|nr:aminotransferase class I/II-fold pyridoxal phosphate-dependent enzyme [Treponema sp.]MCQ2240057.1 aminotransferase class I/II-fold pyridoxal phosphate-dependent enzyme [Treponema sp.]
MHGGDIYSTKVKYDFSVNVNPFPLPIKIFWKYVFSFARLKEYPDQISTELIDAISKRYNVSPEKIIAGNGASEIILSAIRAIMPKKAILISPCFTGYEHALKSSDTEIIYFSLDEKDNFNFTEDKFLELKDMLYKEKPKMLFLCNPNNPNGKLFAKETIIHILEFCKKSGILVLLDECFMDLTGKSENFSLVEKLDVYDNLVMINALTKTFAVPGLRLGFCFCSSTEINSKIKSQLPEWNVSVIAQKIGTELLHCEKFISKTTKKLSLEIKYLSDKLEEIGFKTYPTDSNFILFYSENEKALKKKLLEKQILIRDCSDYQNLDSGYYRIAVKKHNENKKLLSSLRKVVGA